MTPKERMLAAIEGREYDYVPCSFMMFFNLARKCKTQAEFVEKQLQLGLDAYAHVGHLKHSLHPDAIRGQLPRIRMIRLRLRTMHT